MQLNESLKEILLKNPDPFPDIIGQESVKAQLVSALISGRHILIVGPPGIGKTTLAKNVAKLLPAVAVNNCPYHCDPGMPACPECSSKKTVKTISIKGIERFIRIQGSPDLTVEDLLGDIDPIKALKFGPLSMEAFTPGKIFRANNGILFFDEVNRCSEKLQNALLQVLEEKKATLGSYDVDIPARFIFIGTMNPEDSSTEKLSDVFLDRFDIIYMSYPEKLEQETAIVKKSGKSLLPFPGKLLEVTLHFVRLLRENKHLEKVPGVRASLGLYERAQATALIHKRREVEFLDVRDALVSVLSHRIRLKPSYAYLQTSTKFLREQMKSHFDKQLGESLAQEDDVP
ncbi:ATP-binding protein [Candidatus Woesearchaeota archaeon]|nr:ATP-binding protein [Candidatus Woesearchaeota archaeon]